MRNDDGFIDLDSIISPKGFDKMLEIPGGVALAQGAEEALGSTSLNDMMDRPDGLAKAQKAEEL
jgi:hypothetical protein